MMNIFVFLIVMAAVAVLAWNFIPAFREFVRGKSTVLEGIGVAALASADVAVQAFQVESTFWSSVIPDYAWHYVTIGLAIWMIFKRVITTSPVGEK